MTEPSRLTVHDWPDWVPEPPVVTHNVYIHDFAMLGSHDVSCTVCWQRPAIWTQDMTPGHYRSSWQPCDPCQAEGWRLVQARPWWRRAMVRLFSKRLPVQRVKS